MDVSRTVSKIKGQYRKSQIFQLVLFNAPAEEVPTGISYFVGAQKN